MLTHPTTMYKQNNIYYINIVLRRVVEKRVIVRI